MFTQHTTHLVVIKNNTLFSHIYRQKHTTVSFVGPVDKGFGEGKAIEGRGMHRQGEKRDAGIWDGGGEGDFKTIPSNPNQCLPFVRMKEWSL